MALIGEVRVKDGEEDAIESGDVGDGLGRWVVRFVLTGRLEHLEILEDKQVEQGRLAFTHWQFKQRLFLLHRQQHQTVDIAVGHSRSLTARVLSQPGVSCNILMFLFISNHAQAHRCTKTTHLITS